MKSGSFKTLSRFLGIAKSDRVKQRSKKRNRNLLLEGLEKREVFAAFAAGNLAVIRANEVDNNAPMSVIELTKTTASQTGDAVQRIDIGSNFRISGSATSTGYLALTNDASRLTFANPVTTDTASNANTITTRSVGVLDATGTFTVGASYTGTSGQQARGATSLDNSAFFIADQGGIHTNGSTAASPAVNVRAVKAFGGIVYVSQASSTAGANIVSTISAPSGGTITSLPGLTNNSGMQDYYLIQSGDNGSTFDVLYTIFATSNVAGTISKFSLVGGSWVANGTAATTFGGFGLAAEDSGAGANLYITSGQGALSANTVLRLIDSAGYNATLNLGTATTLYTAPTGNTVKGISFVPTASTAPEVNVTGNSVTIVDGDTTPSTSDHTQFPSTIAGNSNTRVFTIQNTGTADLTLGSPTSSSALFAISGFPAGPITAGNSATFSVIFSPTAAGSFTSTISFGNNDSDENPYDFVVGGDATAASAPEVNVLGNSVTIVDGDTTPSLADHTIFVDAVAGNTTTRTYTIQNTGSADLTLSTPASSNGLFTISGFPAGPITAGNSATFNVVFAPVAAGAFTSTISFGNNDSDENPYDFVVSGTGLAAIAEANVLGNGVSIVDGDTTPDAADHTVFVSAAIGATSSRTYTIQNLGTIDLTLSTFTSSNPRFTIPTAPSGPVAPGGSATFTVVFSPLVASTETATISFANNDSDENPYDFVVSATGITIADIRLNEIFVNPSGTDDNREFVEIRSVSGGVVSLAGLTLLVIESDTGTANGVIDGILPLDSFSTGTNGLLQLGFDHATANPWPVVSGTSVGNLNLTGSSGPNLASAGTLENGGITFLIVSGFTGVAAGTDLSTSNDGVFTTTPWSSIVDSVGWGSTAVFSAAVVTPVSGTPDAVSRILGNTTASSTTAWFGGDVEGTPVFAQGYVATGATANLPAGAGFTPGGVNYSQTISATPASITVPEGSSNTFSVSLSTAPFTAVTVSIAQTGDADLTASSTSLTFAVGSTAAQTVTINAAEDADSVNGSATFEMSATNLTSQSVTATEVDNDSLVTPTITITSGNVVYSNTVYVATATVTGFAAPDPTSSLTFTFYSDAGGTNVISAPENVGTYFVRAFTAANAGNNAAQSAITSFQITPFALTATASASNKVYDGNPSAVVTINLTGVFSGDTVTGSATGTFDNKNAGAGKTVTVGTVTLAGADSANYTVGSAPSTMATISQRPLTVTAVTDSKPYDTNTSSTGVPTLTGSLVGGDTGTFTQSFATPFVGTGKTINPAASIVDGNSGNNYLVTLTPVTTGAITSSALVPTSSTPVVNGGAGFANPNQRSQLTQFTVNFSVPVIVTPASFTFENLGLLTASGPTALGATLDILGSGTTSITIRFNAGVGVVTRTGLGGTTGNSLVDGNWRITINAGAVTDANGQPMLSSPQHGNASTDNFFRMFGDSDGDGDVDGTDVFALRAARTVYNPIFDANGNGDLANSSDVSLFNGNFGRRRRVF